MPPKACNKQVTCRYCSAEGEHLSMMCPTRPPKKGIAPPEGADELDANEITESQKVVAELQAADLVLKGFLSPTPEPEQLLHVTIDNVVKVSSSDDVKLAMGVHWFDGMAPYCSREGRVLKRQSERTVYLEFLNDASSADSITRACLTVPIACLDAVS